MSIVLAVLLSMDFTHAVRESAPSVPCPPIETADRVLAAAPAEVTPATQDFDIDARPLIDFLLWVAHETGRHIEFVDARAQAVADRTRLHGSIRGLTPLESLESVLSTTSLQFELRGNEIRVSSRH